VKEPAEAACKVSLDAACKLSPDDVEGVDELSVRAFRAFLNAVRLHRQLTISAIAERHSHPGQALCLRFLSTNDGITQRDLAEALHLARPTVSKMLQAMEKTGAIERRPDERDQRLTRVHLTAAGRELEAGLRVITAATIKETMGTLPEADRRELERLLGALSASISTAIEARRDERTPHAAAGRDGGAYGDDGRDRAVPSQAAAGHGSAEPQ
jgi:DNA-binding MarR family transcriptional regulator